MWRIIQVVRCLGIIEAEQEAEEAEPAVREYNAGRRIVRGILGGLFRGR